MNQHFQNLKIIALALVLSVGMSFAYAWVAPTAAPPGGNAAQPITTSATAQIKTGKLTVGALAIPGAVTGQVLTATGNAAGDLTWSTTAGDNLGNHTATQGLNMNTQPITGATNVTSSQFTDKDNGGYYIDPNGTSPVFGVSAQNLTVQNTGIFNSNLSVTSGINLGSNSHFRERELTENYYFRCTVPNGANLQSYYLTGNCNWANGGWPAWPNPAIYGCLWPGSWFAPTVAQSQNILANYGAAKGIAGAFYVNLDAWTGLSAVNYCGGGGVDGTQGYITVRFRILEAYMS